jgi:hypothetical protein
MENVGKTRKNDGNMLRNSWESDGKHWGKVDTVDDFRWNKWWNLMIWGKTMEHIGEIAIQQTIKIYKPYGCV